DLPAQRNQALRMGRYGEKQADNQNGYTSTESAIRAHIPHSFFRGVVRLLAGAVFSLFLNLNLNRQMVAAACHPPALARRSGPVLCHHKLIVPTEAAKRMYQDHCSASASSIWL